MNRTFVSAIDPPAGSDPPDLAWWFIFRGSELLVVADGADSDGIPLLADLAELAVEPVRRNYLGALADRHCYAVEIAPDLDPPPGAIFRNLRALYGRVPDDLFALAGRAAQIVEWDRSHQFCGRCGMPTVYAPGERAKRCPACGQVSFPRLSPAIIVLVERGDQVLLARGTGFPDGMYSTLAGFVEPGESLEGAVHREIFEEAGIVLTDLRYFGSQPWPFPHSLMIGFTAQYAGGEIVIDPAEIADAQWFTVDTLPRVPQKLSIARRLIDSYVAKHGPPLDQP
ncbi:MAG: diphosphatase [Thermomicrobiales bacterium]|nr:diphosphatase [Thermomicrobiales bacterium]